MTAGDLIPISAVNTGDGLILRVPGHCILANRRRGEGVSHGRIMPVRHPYHPAVAAVEQVVIRLGWARETDKIVFAHTHQPLEDVRGPSGAIRYWTTGSWIYEPDLRTRETYLGYLRNAWPGTAVLIDTDEPSPRLLRLREHLNPIHGSGGSASDG